MHGDTRNIEKVQEFKFITSNINYNIIKKLADNIYHA
jgi:hypothetical protein